MHPLESRFKRAIETAYAQPMDYLIYDIKLSSQPKYPQFFNNFSVGYLLSQNPLLKFAQGKTLPLSDGAGFFVHINPGALPRIFTVNCVVVASEEEQLWQLVSGDLREAAYVSSSVYKELQESYGWRNLGESFSFADLQDKNKIMHINIDNPNYIEIDIDVSVPAMLVFTEVWYPGWEASVDSQSKPLYRINYCQRGVWVQEGTHNVKLKFRPVAWRLGLVVSTGTIILISGIGLAAGIRRILKLKSK